MTLQRATFTRLAADLVTEIGSLTVQYNPNKLSLSKGVSYAEIGIPGLNAPIQQFVRGQAETLSVDLFFDTTEFGMNEEESVRPVTLLTDQFYQLIHVDPELKAPPICRFAWGQSGFPGSNLSGTLGELRRDNGFQGVVENVSLEFTLFSPLGVPLRATVSVKMRQYLTLNQQVTVLNEQRARIVEEGQTLDQIANREYNDPGKWREIADFNGIEDPLNLATGTVLDVPPL